MPEAVVREPYGFVPGSGNGGMSIWKNLKYPNRMEVVKNSADVQKVGDNDTRACWEFGLEMKGLRVFGGERMNPLQSNSEPYREHLKWRGERTQRVPMGAQPGNALIVAFLTTG